MKIIIAGSRGIDDYEIIKKGYRESGLTATEIVSGGARGVDKLGEQLANELGIPCKIFLADWNGPLKKGAGYARNVQMADYADALLAFWDNKSPGTKHMLNIAKSKNLIVRLRIINNE